MLTGFKKENSEVNMNKITKFERARIIGARALQISMGAPFLVKITPEELERVCYNPIEVAKMEFAADALPLAVRRPMPKRVQVAEAKAATA